MNNYLITVFITFPNGKKERFTKYAQSFHHAVDLFFWADGYHNRQPNRLMYTDK
jgi:hypothetical protein